MADCVMSTVFCNATKAYYLLAKYEIHLNSINYTRKYFDFNLIMYCSHCHLLSSWPVTELQLQHKSYTCVSQSEHHSLTLLYNTCHPFLQAAFIVWWNRTHFLLSFAAAAAAGGGAEAEAAVVVVDKPSSGGASLAKYCAANSRTSMGFTVRL